MRLKITLNSGTMQVTKIAPIPQPITLKYVHATYSCMECRQCRTVIYAENGKERMDHLGLIGQYPVTVPRVEQVTIKVDKPTQEINIFCHNCQTLIGTVRSGIVLFSKEIKFVQILANRVLPTNIDRVKQHKKILQKKLQESYRQTVYQQLLRLVWLQSRILETRFKCTFDRSQRLNRVIHNNKKIANAYCLRVESHYDNQKQLLPQKLSVETNLAHIQERIINVTNIQQISAFQSGKKAGKKKPKFPQLN